MASIDTKIDLWKNKLLDLGRRNRLVNFKDTRISTIRIVEPSCIEMYKYFVVDENKIIFPKEIYEDDESEMESDSFIKTDKSDADLPRALRNIRNKAKTALEEQGINMLYLTFGFLRYREAAHSNIDIFAPIVLVPVSLTIESITDPYILSLHEDEIVVNPTLVYKLKTEFGMNLPTFDDTDDLEGYFNDLRKSIKETDWDIEEGVALGLLSFLKINMYNDMQNHINDIKSNPIVCSISGDVSSLEKVSEKIMDLSDYDFDRNENPRDVFQIVDADSSQQEAIFLAKRGASFVLQGPPGTGKSQTITNIIAECLATGKKVLFVSEKQAALDVVHHRLECAGLADFCLVLHSYKANKRNVLNQLEKTIALAQKKATLSDEAFEKLNTLSNDRERLNQYVKQLHTLVEPLKQTVYEVNGALANLESYPNLIFDIPRIQTVSRDALVNVELVLQKYAYVVEKLNDDFRSNPWRGSDLEFISNEYRHDAGAYLPILKKELLLANQIVEEVNKQTHIGFPATFDGIAGAMDLLDGIHDSYAIPPKWIYDICLENYHDDIIAAKERQERYCNLVAEIEDIYLKADIRETINLKTLEHTNEFKDKLHSILSSEVPYTIWNHRDSIEIENLLNEIEKFQKSIEKCEKLILQDYDSAVFSIDHKAIITRIRTEYTSFLRVFKSSYKDDKKQIMAYKRDVSSKVTDAEMRDVVKKLEDRELLYRWFDENRSRLNEYFGDNKIQPDTNLEVFWLYYKKYICLRKVLKMLDELIIVHDEETIFKDNAANKFPEMYQGFDTDWDIVEKALNWATRFKKLVQKYNPQVEFVEAACGSLMNEKLVK